MNVICYSDGASRGNPGQAGAGAVVEHDGKVLRKVMQYLGICTNNVAEYQGLLLALETAAELGAAEVHCRLDSALVVLQMQGIYRVRDAKLQPLFQQAQEQAARFRRVTFEHVRRERNRKADALANAAIDGQRKGR